MGEWLREGEENKTKAGRGWGVGWGGGLRRDEENAKGMWIAKGQKSRDING